jgi:hypothetical protein
MSINVPEPVPPAIPATTTTVTLLIPPALIAFTFCSIRSFTLLMFSNSKSLPIWRFPPAPGSAASASILSYHSASTTLDSANVFHFVTMACLSATAIEQNSAPNWSNVAVPQDFFIEVLSVSKARNPMLFGVSETSFPFTWGSTMRRLTSFLMRISISAPVPPRPMNKVAPVSLASTRALS